ncbi:ankyrin repeat and sam domain containing protein 6 [Colletotrichum kahawae]|uniref:Ankyrin repeat and sam domain containing protein 6 n=1 Tax=Colletotrichum kahawae TaxID=34407 RepID=A0AAD9YC67_COLKA|nr:ankyrin repeat and sam domain containing protein 6 [Colletotrichum kahawae]
MLSTSKLPYQNAQVTILPFNYDPLDLFKRGIRLLRLLKSYAGPICCELFEVQVTERGCDTPYEALSYVWGSSDLTHRIEVNGKELSITANLHVALSHLRLIDADRVLWVDAVCIDQNNHKERGHQVQQMGDIYHQARQVVVWLGEATSETDAFMTVLQKLRADMESEGSPYRNWVPKYDNPSQKYWYN